MKKGLMVVVAVFAAVFMFTGVKNVSAMTENDLRTKVNAGATINGNTITVPTRYLNLFNDYLDQYELTDSDCQYISDQIDVLIDAARNNGVTSFADMETKCASQIRQACANVSANTGVKATVLSNGNVSVSKYQLPNEVFAVVGTHLAVNTGTASLLFIAGIITLIGVCLLVNKARKAE